MRVPEEVFSQVLKHDEVDGVFCISDAVATEAVRFLESRGKRVPEDIKVMGYDGGRTFLNLGKRLTSINQDPRLIAKAIVKIVNAYYDKEEVKSEIIPVSFVYGETT
jgi:DNA-binding LacI/PurR family transcriptional regulator